MRRSREAPSAVRIAISRARVAARARSKIGDVGAGDQQNERDRAEQHQEHRPKAADHLLVHRDQGHAGVLVRLRILLLQAERDRVHLRLGLREGHARSQACPGIEIALVTHLTSGSR